MLCGPMHDLVVRLELPEGHAGRAWLERHLGPDPRVRVAPSRSALEEFPASPFHVTLPAGKRLHGDVVRRLRAGLGTAVVGRSEFPGGSRVSIVRAWGAAPGAAHAVGGLRLRRCGDDSAPEAEGGARAGRFDGPGVALVLGPVPGRVASGRWSGRGVAVRPVVRRCGSAAGAPALAHRHDAASSTCWPAVADSPP